MLRQSKTVWSVAFASVISFMGIGLVDPILKPIADELGASPSQVSLLFTSYLAVTGVAMLGTGWVSSRIGAKRTLLVGLALIIVGAGFAGGQDTVNGIVAFRALWGLGNALFIATALATIVNAASGSVKQAIILYEAALGVGIATGPLLGGWLGSISWRWPFFGVAILMAVAFTATATSLPKTPRAPHATSLMAPIRALGHRGLLTVGITALLYNFGFFTLLAFTPFPLGLGAQQIGFIFFGWGLLLALTSVFVAPWIQRQVGITFVFVTHDQEEALTMSDRIAVFHAGRIEQVGSPAEVYETPSGRFVAGFVGTSNLLAPDVARTVLGKPGTWSVRPEKIRLTSEADAVAADEHSAAGTIAEVVYAGVSTHFFVDLDAGARLMVLQQNLHSSSNDVSALRGTRARLVWRREHEFQIIEKSPAEPVHRTANEE